MYLPEDLEDTPFKEFYNYFLKTKCTINDFNMGGVRMKIIFQN